MSPFRVAALLVLMMAFASRPAAGCNVPVFRYALERWKPSAYAIHVFHRGDLSAGERDQLRRLEDGKLNATVTRVDLAGTVTAEARDLWQRQGDGPRLPWVVVHFPEEDGKAAPAWTGPLTEEAVGRLVDSPARRRLAALLLRGEAAVWLRLTSDKAAADRAAGDLLAAELKRLEATLTIPPPVDDGDLLTRLPLRISFPVVVVDRDDPAEAALVGLLRRSEPDLASVSGPIIVPVFGRGRALLALHGEELTAANLERWATFLCGPCSCQVKDLNPGVDLPLAVSWEEALEQAAPVAAEKPTAPPIPPGTTTPAPARHPAAASPWLTPAVIVLTIAALAVLVVLGRRHRSE